ncbi:MAG: glycosyltransferase family 4 protein [Actinomycetota bacterium]|jgi:glycosyltransferase involved in cell wall biosynthesis|nr:glycosyltransferase family 4 protein [Actinomycetota bacterium]
MTRVVLLPSAYLPALGGVEELTRHLALALVAAGDDVEVWTGHASDTGPAEVETRDGIVVRRFPLPLPAATTGAVTRFALGAPRTFRMLRRAVDEFRPDVLHVQCFGPNGVYAMALAGMLHIPLVVTLQGETVMDDADIFDTSRIMQLSLRWALRHAAAVTGCSRFTLADAETRFGLRPGQGRVVWNGVDLAATGDGGGDPDAGWTPPSDRPYILALGRVVEKKGFDLLLAAYAAMPEEQRQADLVIGGSGGALGPLRQRAGQLGVAGQVHFPGRLSRDQVAAAMAGAALFVMPSRVEPFGIVVLEAWRAGVAVVATTHGGPPELIRSGEDGVLVDPFDTGAFASALGTLLADTARRSAIAAAGQRRVAELAWPRIAEQYRQVHADAVAAAGRAPRPGLRRSGSGPPGPRGTRS